VTSTSTDDEGETYALFASVIPAEDVSIMIVPLKPPAEEDVLDFTFLSSGKSLFVKIHEVPRGRNTYGHVASYSAGTVDKPYPVGATIRFATTTNFVIAKPRLVAAIMGAVGAEVNSYRVISIVGEASTPTGDRGRVG
jgi:hypothetical protein